MKSGLQEHIGLWANTLHSEFFPQLLGHGFTHLKLTQALLVGHSVLTLHSGLHPGGEPT